MEKNPLVIMTKHGYPPSRSGMVDARFFHKFHQWRILYSFDLLGHYFFVEIFCSFFAGDSLLSMKTCNE